LALCANFLSIPVPHLRTFAVIFCLGPSALPGCNAKELVALTTEAQAPTLRVEQALLGSSLSGGFDLAVKQGSEASGSTTVTLNDLGIRTQGGPVVLDSLPVEVSPTFPFDLAPGKSQTVRFELDDGKTIDAEAAGQLCGTGQKFEFFGAVSDSLSGDATPFASASFQVDCP